ncbi:MAG: hypothetical protein KAI40_05580 [Desulfobacterales bacterium]|nr:hypothetical protein [Desulfobacterales bacterium]
MIYLNANDIVKILSLREIIDAIEKALLIMSTRQFFMPERFHIAQDNNTLLLMPCFTEKYFGTKLVSVFPDNVEKDKPVIYGNMMLNLADTVFVDTMVAKKESGDLVKPMKEGWIKDDQIVEIADLVAGKIAVDKNKRKTQVFKSVGMGLFDLIVAQALFEKAVKLKIGQKIIT